MKRVMNTESLKTLGVKFNYPMPIEAEASSIQLRAFKMYSIPISNYSTDDLRFMIIQKIGLTFLIPIAIDVLRNNIFIEGNYYEGDLLNAVLIVQEDFWKKNINLLIDFSELLLNNKELFDALIPNDEVNRNLITNYKRFIGYVK